jgi:hypothetical protein
MENMTLQFTGTIIPGVGSAHINHRFLIPQLAQHYPPIANCSRFGTINVRLDQRPIKNVADYWTPQIRWRPCWLRSDDPDRVEAFGFTKIKFECPLGDQMHDAWIMYPEGSTVTWSEYDVEIIAGVFVAAAQHGVACAMYLDVRDLIPRPSWFGRSFDAPVIMPMR